VDLKDLESAMFLAALADITRDALEAFAVANSVPTIVSGDGSSRWFATRRRS
jgi:hypothetical protein